MTPYLLMLILMSYICPLRFHAQRGLDDLKKLQIVVLCYLAQILKMGPAVVPVAIWTMLDMLSALTIYMK